MSFPVVIQGLEAEHRSDYATQMWPLGQKLITLDGRAYRFHKTGASTLVVGDVVDGPANITNHLATAAVATAAGSATIVATLGATASAKDQYQGGYASIVLTPGGGETYILNRSPNITTHEAVASAGVITALLANGETIVTALTTTSDVTWILNPYSGTIQSPITTLISQMIGVAVKASTTGRFGWIQTRGIATVLASGTVVVGTNVVRLTAAAAAAGPAAAATSEVVGRANQVGSTWTVVDLTIDG